MTGLELEVVEAYRHATAQGERAQLAAGEHQPSLRPRDVRAPLAVGKVEGDLRLANDDLVLLVEVLRIPRRDLPEHPSVLHLDPPKAADVLRDGGKEIAAEVGEGARAMGPDGARDLVADAREGRGYHDEQRGA